MTVSNVLQTGLLGIQAGMQRANLAGGRVATAEPDADVLARAAIDQMSGRHQVSLSAQVVKAADEMLGTLIDTRA